MVASCAPCTRDLDHNPAMYPDWESNRQPFGSQAGAQSTEPHQLGQHFYNYHLFSVVRTFRIHTLSSFLVYNTALLTVTTILYIRSTEHTHPKTGSLCPDQCLPTSHCQPWHHRPSLCSMSSICRSQMVFLAAEMRFPGVKEAGSEQQGKTVPTNPNLNVLLPGLSRRL